jgi:phosphatidylserine/phosphatidylglycerophosphate/cardiolipin synthase-like enzyme
MNLNGFIKTKVCFDDYYENDDPNLLYDAFIFWDDKGWNGWANPYLLQKDRDKLIENMISAYGEIDETVQGLIQTESQVIDGVTVYDFGGCYCWNIEDDYFKKKKMDVAFGPDFMESENKGDIEHYDKDLKSDDIYALLSEHFNYKIEFRSMSKKELKTFIKDLLDGKSEYFLNDDFPREVLITFLKEQG